MTLVKINIETNPVAAQQMQVKSIPAVFGFANGKPVDGFMGVQSATEIDAFVTRLAAMAADPEADQIEEMLTQADAALQADAGAEALQMFTAILASDPENARAMAGYAQCYIRSQDFDQAENILNSVSEKLANEEPILLARKALELARQVAEAGDPSEHLAKLEADPNNHQARLDLALAQMAAGRNEDAVESMLEIIRRDSKWKNGLARTKLLEMFETFGDDDPATQAGRLQLANLLFS